MLAGLRRVPKFEEILGNGETYDLDERLAYNAKPATAYREGFFHVGQNDLVDAEYDTKHEAVLAALDGIKNALEQRAQAHQNHANEIGEDHLPGPHNVMQQVAIPPPPPGPPPAPQVHGNQARQAARGQWRGGQAPPPLPPPPLLRQQAINRRVPDSDGSASTRSGTRASSGMSSNISSRASSGARAQASDPRAAANAPRYRSVRRNRNDTPSPPRFPGSRRTGGRNQAGQALDGYRRARSR